MQAEDMSVMSSVQRWAMVRWMERYLANFNLQSSSAYDDLLAFVLMGLTELSGHDDCTTTLEKKGAIRLREY